MKSHYTSCVRLLTLLSLLALGLRVGYVLTEQERLIFPDETGYQQVARTSCRVRPQLSPDAMQFVHRGIRFFW